MNKQPFIINLHEGELPNLAKDEPDKFGFEYNRTNSWQDDNIDVIRLLNSINEKLDAIVELLIKNGRE